MCMGQPALHTTDRITPGFFWLLLNSVWLHFSVHEHGIQWSDQSSRWGTSTGGQLPQTWENNPENTHSPDAGNPPHKQLHNKLYHHTIGASRGTIRSPEICDICLRKILKQLSQNSPHENKIKIHARFLDDGYMIWEKAPAHDVTDFFQTANNFHNLLRFTPTTSPQGITFLDTRVYKGKRFTLKRTGYQNMHQNNWDIPVSRSSMWPPQLGIPWIHKRNRVSRGSAEN